MSTEYKERIHAQHLRKTLISRHGVGSVFARMLELLSDAELIAQSEQHHAMNLARVRQSAQVKVSGATELKLR